MSSDPSNYSSRYPPGSATTFVYDAARLMPRLGDAPPITRVEWRGRGFEAAVPTERGPLTPPPRWAHTFEFRLAGTETQEQCVPLSPELQPAEFILATPSVRAYLTRTNDPTEMSSAIGGVEVQAELRAGVIVCRASLADFSPGDLVVVQIDVALEPRCGRGG